MKMRIFQTTPFASPVSPRTAAAVGLLLLGMAAGSAWAADQPQAGKTPVQATPAERDARAPEDRVLEGAWDIIINTTPNPPFAVPFRILRTVTAAGVTDAYAFPSITPTQPTGASPLVNTSGHGDWGVLDHGYYSVTVKYFQLNPIKLDVLDTVGTVRENIRMAPDGNSYTSVFETTITLPNGQTILTNQGRTIATRITVKPLLYLP